ncbi:hypothetical protein MIR68_011336 [Amoeboaphelidium protococcarum]|nr:hypothetical protein MIR68_011336 [Amoeboaphelidium protococcarum]
MKGHADTLRQIDNQSLLNGGNGASLKSDTGSKTHQMHQIQTSHNLKTNTKLQELMTMPLTPFTASPKSGMYRCFICWESSGASDEFILPCKCKNENLKFAHTKCIERWVNDNGKTSCAVCTAPYKFQVDHLPASAILRKNFWILLSFLIQITLPLSIYLILYLNGALSHVNGVLIAAHLLMLLVMYAAFTIHVFSGLDRYKKKVIASEDIQRV